MQKSLWVKQENQPSEAAYRKLWLSFSPPTLGLDSLCYVVSLSPLQSLPKSCPSGKVAEWQHNWFPAEGPSKSTVQAAWFVGQVVLMKPEEQFMGCTNHQALRTMGLTSHWSQRLWERCPSLLYGEKGAWMPGFHVLSYRWTGHRLWCHERNGLTVGHVLLCRKEILIIINNVGGSPLRKT